MDPVVAIATKEVVKISASKCVDSLMNYCALNYKLKLSRSVEKDLIERLTNIRFVKTLWQVEKNVDLESFYVDPFVKHGARRYPIRSYNEFGSNRQSVLIGVAGQGKSIFLRYLASDSTKYGNVLPIFTQLRKLRETQTIKQYIAEILGVNNKEYGDDLVFKLFKSEKISLFLDGYDELGKEKKKQVLDEIEGISDKFPKTFILISSRPYTNIEYSNFLSVYTLSTLAGDEYKDIVRAVCADSSYSINVCRQVDSNRQSISQLLVTPLLVTMLVMIYRCNKYIPSTLSEFYENIFPVLLSKHDEVKADYVRPRRSKLSDFDFRQVFDGFCYYSKSDNGISFSISKSIKYTTHSLDHCRLQCSPESFIKDIVEITSLLVREGDDLSYIHKTVQEYHSSSYIKEFSSCKKELFYRRVWENKEYWGFELQLLCDRDPYAICKYFLSPRIGRFISSQRRQERAIGHFVNNRFSNQRGYIVGRLDEMGYFINLMHAGGLIEYLSANLCGRLMIEKIRVLRAEIMSIYNMEVLDKGDKQSLVELYQEVYKFFLNIHFEIIKFIRKEEEDNRKLNLPVC